MNLGTIPRGTGLDSVHSYTNGFQQAKQGKHFSYLDVIHTSAGFGKTQALGDVDFYPNGGSVQPCTCKNPCQGIDCKKDKGQKSDHARAVSYYEVYFMINEDYNIYKQKCLSFKESISSPESFPAWKCGEDELDLNVNAKDRSCPYNAEKEIANMGEWVTKNGFPKGLFYLTTKGTSPFSCNETDCFTE